MPPKREKELLEWERINKKPAKKLRNKPKLLTYMQELLNCFMDLSRRRQFGMSELPLSVESINDYGEKFGYRDELRFFFRCMSGLDDEFLQFKATRREAEQSNKPDSPPPDKRRQGKKS